jgi:cytochrome c peroxidase
MLFYDTRFSKAQETLQQLPRSRDLGRRRRAHLARPPRQRGARPPSVYNAAFHFAQFWMGARPTSRRRRGPVLNPIEMGCRTRRRDRRDRSIPGYAPLFAAPFRAEESHQLHFLARDQRLRAPARHLGPLRRVPRGQRTRSPTRRWPGSRPSSTRAAPPHGADDRRPDLQARARRPYPTHDAGRFGVTKNEADRQFFKVPSCATSRRPAPGSTMARQIA